MKSRTRIMGMVVALVSVAVAFTALSCDSNTEEDHESVTIAQWGKERYLIYLPVYLAQAEGLFRKHGVEVRITFSGNDDQVFATVARGDAQFGVGDPIFTAISRQRGFDGLVVASIVDKVALWGVAKADSPVFSSPVDFADTRIGTFPRPSTTYSLLREMLDAHGVQGARIIETPIGNETALLESDNADVVMMLEPGASIAEARGYVVVTSFPELWGSFAFTGLTTTESYAEQHPAIVAAMRAALQDALDLAHTSPDRAIDVARDLFPTLDPHVVASAVRRMLEDETLPASIGPDRDGWLRATAVRVTLGDLAPGSECLECLYSPSGD